MFDLTLTFDNGPTGKVTHGVLDVLASYDVRATFFVVGQKLASPGGSDAVSRAHEEGHWIGNHTWSHREPFGKWPRDEDPATEILKTQQALGQLAHPNRYFRPPGGGGNLNENLLSPSALECIKAQKMTMVLWNSIPRDWEEPDSWVSNAMEQLLQSRWSLTVLHDTDTGAMRHLPRFIETVLDAGGRFRQEFPSECVPIVRGEVTGPIDQFIAAERGREIL